MKKSRWCRKVALIHSRVIVLSVGTGMFDHIYLKLIRWLVLKHMKKKKLYQKQLINEYFRIVTQTSLNINQKKELCHRCQSIAIRYDEKMMVQLFLFTNFVHIHSGILSTNLK